MIFTIARGLALVVNLIDFLMSQNKSITVPLQIFKHGQTSLYYNGVHCILIGIDQPVVFKMDFGYSGKSEAVIFLIELLLHCIFEIIHNRVHNSFKDVLHR